MQDIRRVSMLGGRHEATWTSRIHTLPYGPPEMMCQSASLRKPSCVGKGAAAANLGKCSLLDSLSKANIVFKWGSCEMITGWGNHAEKPR
jgi:hypothetical protein